jgi:hypothetical protein
MKNPRLIMLLVVIVCAAALAQTKTAPRIPTSSVAMAPAPSVPATGHATVAADFNGDGKIDIATTGTKNGGVTIRLGKGDGTFLPAVTYRPGYYYDAIVAGDFNGDGKTDLAVSLPFLCGGCGGYPSFLLQVFLGAGDGSFTVVAPKHPFYGLPLAVGDFNRDGKLDVIVTNTDYYGEDWIPSIALGNGDGTFSQGASLWDTYLATFPAVGDLNGDGKLDIAMPALDGTQGNSISYVYLGNGDGTFQSAVYSGTAYWGITAALGDFNGDGKLDIATDGIQVLLNNGDGTFTNDASVNVRGLAGTSIVGGVAVGDFNGDGKIDFAAGAPVGGYSGAFVFLSNGDGTFKQVTVDGTAVLQAAEFNNDGRLDLLTGAGLFLQTQASLLPSVLTFGDIPVNTQSQPQTLTLTNVGNVPMTIKSLQLTGTGAAQYSQTNNCGSTLAAGRGCQIQVVFAPTATGTFNASLSVTVPGAPASTATTIGYGQ